ncbi:hypothetical protein Ciccas_009538, partial [Cichlidogyrus casuarinus]
GEAKTPKPENGKPPPPRPPKPDKLLDGDSFDNTPKGESEAFTFEESDSEEETSMAKQIFSKFEGKSAKNTISDLIDNRKAIMQKSENLAKKVMENVKEKAKIVEASDKSGAPKSLAIGNKRLSINMNESGLPNLRLSDSQHPLVRQTTTEKSMADQQFLRECVQNVITGQSIGLRTKGRLRTLMEDENYRNYVVAKLNSNQVLSQDSHVNDVQLLNKNAYNNYVWLMLTIVRGLENSFANRGVGGMSSALMALEIAHIHFYDPNQTLPVKPDTSETIRSSPSDEVGGTDNVISQFTNWFKNKPKTLHTKGMELSNKLIQKGAQVGEAGRDGLVKMVDKPQDTAINLASGLGDLISKASANIQGNSAPQEPKKVTQNENSTTDKDDENVLPIKCRLAGLYRFTKGKLIKCSCKKDQEMLERVYVFESLISVKERSKCWDNIQLWEDAFLDSVAQERDIIGLDQAPMEMVERYSSLSPSERKHLELDEDRLLATLLHNLVAFMLMMKVERAEILSNVRRIMARCRIGQHFSQNINTLLESLPYLNGNGIDLLPLMSLTMPKKSFTVHLEHEHTPLFLEVYQDKLLMRNLTGAIADRLFYDKLLNMTFCPSKESICLWRADSGECASTAQVILHSRKSKELYNAIKNSMSKLSGGARLSSYVNFEESFPATLLSTGETGSITVNQSGIQFSHESQILLSWDLNNIKRCFTESNNIFVLEDF